MRGSLSRLAGFAACCGTLALVTGGCGGVTDPGAEAAFKAAVGSMSVTVFPVYVRDADPHYDAAEAGRIRDFLLSERIAASVTLAQAEIPITGKWGIDQAKMYRESLEDFKTHARQNAFQTDYAMLAEYLVGGRGNIVGVHLYAVDQQGKVPYGMSCNSHHGEFQAVDPQTPPDATEVLMRKMRADLK